MMRLDRFLSGQTALSRREIGEAVRRARVTVNGAAVRSPDLKINPETDRVTLDGKPVCYAEYHYFLLHKPAGVLTAARDRSQKTVMDLLKPEDRLPGLFPCGRLDKDTSGLLLITDDGALSHRLLSPKHHITKYYLAQLRDPYDTAYEALFRSGMALREGSGEEICLPAECQGIGPHLAVVALCEGKYHQVRRMFAAAGNFVEKLLRFQLGALEMPANLAQGAYLTILPKDVETMLKTSSISLAAAFCSVNYSSYWINERAHLW
ncbi:MAG: rRNA pseudouridine synthase [Oscillospiraceae bacterium]|nr:rRNA pseudouridine synthase [Oscillospiraceae bacterium]